MAYANTTSSANVAGSDRFFGIVTAVKLALSRRRAYSQTLFELNALSDRDLSDLGMIRSNIPKLAHEAAYGK